MFYIAEAEALLYRDFKNNKQDDYGYTYVFQFDCESCNFLLFIMHKPVPGINRYWATSIKLFLLKETTIVFGEVQIKLDRHWPITTSSVITQVVLLTDIDPLQHAVLLLKWSYWQTLTHYNKQCYYSSGLTNSNH